MLRVHLDIEADKLAREQGQFLSTQMHPFLDGKIARLAQRLAQHGFKGAKMATGSAMKPRLKSAHETLEDWDVWLWVNAVWLKKNPPGPRWQYTESDIRDADLMFGVLQGRNLRIDHPGDPSGDFSGWLFDIPGSIATSCGFRRGLET